MSINTKDFERFLRLEKCLSERIISGHISNIEAYLRSELNTMGKRGIDYPYDWIIEIEESKIYIILLRRISS